MQVGVRGSGEGGHPELWKPGNHRPPGRGIGKTGLCFRLGVRFIASSSLGILLSMTHSCNARHPPPSITVTVVTGVQLLSYTGSGTEPTMPTTRRRVCEGKYRVVVVVVAVAVIDDSFLSGDTTST